MRRSPVAGPVGPRVLAPLAVALVVALTAGCAGTPARPATSPTTAAPTVTTPSAVATTAAHKARRRHVVRPTAVPTTTTPAPTTPPPPATSPPTPGPTTQMSFSAHGHRYVFPVQGCSSSYSSSHHDYPASDIFTQKGCAFVATTAGRVDEVSYVDRWDPNKDYGATRGGLSVSIVGDDGVRYYGSHLEKIADGIEPGARVKAGQTLGLIDNSGDAKYVPTHVHYGISWPTRAGIWWVRRGMVWPQRYLASWKAGGDLSPADEVARVHRQDGDEPKCQAEC